MIYKIIKSRKVNKKNRLNLDDYQLWLEDKDLSKETVKNYLKSINLFGRLDVSTETMRAYIKQNINKQEPSSLLTHMRNLAQYAKFSKQYIEWKKVIRLIPKHQRKLFATLNEKDYARIKQARYETEDIVWERNNLIMDFFLYSGLRVSELVNIKLTDFQSHTIVNVIGKGNRFRQIFIPEVLGKKALTFNKKTRIYLFTNYNSEKLTREMIARMIQERAKKADFNMSISPHTLRRTYATRSYNKGIGLINIQKLMGHSSITTTQSYIHNDYDTVYEDYSKLFKGDANLASYVE